jgi:hypothetical protein
MRAPQVSPPSFGELAQVAESGGPRCTGMGEGQRFDGKGGQKWTAVDS